MDEEDEDILDDGEPEVLDPVAEHRADVARIHANLRARGFTPSLRDGFDPRFDGPW